MIGVLLLIAVCLIIGVYLHFKIIRVCKKDKDITWRLDITNSIVLILHFFHCIFMHILTHFVQDLYIYTGEWFCYASKVLQFYGVLFHFGHTLIVSIMKYVIIVHWQKVMSFGKDRVVNIFFWAHFLHPIVTILLWLSVRTDFFWAWDEMYTFDRCLGDPKNNHGPNSNRSIIKLNNICDFLEPNQDSYFKYIGYLLRMTICGFNLASFYLILWNFFEMIFYFLTFRFMHR
jgi:hypothetical protein